MNRPSFSQLVAAAALAFGSSMPFGDVHRYTPPADPGHYKSGRKCGKGGSKCDRAFRNRVAKRRAKKGYR